MNNAFITLLGVWRDTYPTRLDEIFRLLFCIIIFFDEIYIYIYIYGKNTQMRINFLYKLEITILEKKIENYTK